MRKSFLALAFLGLFVAQKSSWADETKEGAASAPKDTTVTAAKAMASLEELEAKFKAMLTKATLSGRWSPTKDGELGQGKEDKYTIVGVAKVNGDSWVVNAKMKYGEREFVLPIPVKVKWAGDTPVVIVDHLQMPGGRNSYTARVLFYEHTYAGTWSGGEHGGLLSGIITNEKEEKTGEDK